MTAATDRLVTDRTIEAAIADLGAAAKVAEGGWLPAGTRCRVGGTEVPVALRRGDVHFRSAGTFDGLPGTPHTAVDLEFDLHLPDRDRRRPAGR